MDDTLSPTGTECRNWNDEADSSIVILRKSNHYKRRFKELTLK